MQCVEENDLEINLMQIPFAQIYFVPSDVHVVTDNPHGMKDISCVRGAVFHRLVT